MPPRKKARTSHAATPEVSQDTPAAPSPSKADEDLLADPWTDEEEIGLFKGLIKWKPTGIHKHFRMLQLRSYLLQHDYIHPRSPHTSTAGIWAKLASLYDLSALDSREDARQLSDLPTPTSPHPSNSDNEDEDEEEEESDIYSLAANKISTDTFALPDEDFAEHMWKRRLPSSKEEKERERSESPAVLPEINLMKEAPVHFTPSFSVEKESAEEPAKASRGRGRPRGVGRGGARGGAAAPAATRKSKRQADEEAEEESKGEEETGSGEEEEEEEEGEEGEEDEDSSEEDEESEESTPAPRSGRGGRGRPARGGGRGRGRGRKK